MKSIRLSLMVYFLGLLALGLGAVSLLVYQTTHQTLLAKKHATEQLLEAQYRADCNEKRERVDHALLAQATALSKVVDFVPKPNPFELTAYGMFANIGHPMGPAIVLGWGPRKPDPKVPPPPVALGWDFCNKYYYEPASERKFNEQILDREVDPQVADYCQINTLLGPSYHSPGLRQENRTLPFDAAAAQHSVIG